MKIAISGAHSQGKTTLLNDLKIRNEFRDFSFLGNITRGIKDRGIEINEAGSSWSQSLVINKHIEHFFTKGNTLLDRCILDGLVYTEVLHTQGKVADDVYHFAEWTFRNLMADLNSYDAIFYVNPELPLVGDNVRSVDREFFDNVVSTFNAVIDYYNIPVVTLTGSREQRVQIVINKLKELNLT